MQESTCYILENIEKSVEIYDAICDMETEVLKKFDGALRENISEWFGNNWSCHTENLHDDYSVFIYRKELEHETETSRKDAKAYICLLLLGEDPIWEFLGHTSRHDDSANIAVQLYMDKSISDRVVDTIFSDSNINKDIISLEKRGFKLKAKKRKYIEKTISFDSNAILKGMKDNDWEDALKPLKSTWSDLVNLNWDEISRILLSNK